MKPSLGILIFRHLGLQAFLSLWGSVTGKLHRKNCSKNSKRLFIHCWRTVRVVNQIVIPKDPMEMRWIYYSYKSLTPFWKGFSYSSAPFGVFLRNRQERNPSRRPYRPSHLQLAPDTSCNFPIGGGEKKQFFSVVLVHQHLLVGGWTNQFEKYDRQIGSFPQGSGWKLQKYLKKPASVFISH